jgi:hypothetical protein
MESKKCKNHDLKKVIVWTCTLLVAGAVRSILGCIVLTMH